jgi:hypothetical protein
VDASCALIFRLRCRQLWCGHAQPIPNAAPDAKAELEFAEPEHPVAEPPEPPTIAADEEFVSVYTADDEIEAEMLTQLLQDEGIPTPGFSRAIGAQIGAGSMAVRHVIRVPASQKKQARELIDTFLAADPGALAPDDEPVAANLRRTAVKVVAGIIVTFFLINLIISLMAIIPRLLGWRRSGPARPGAQL